MVERVILVSKKGVEIPYKDVTSIYKSIKQVNANKILQFIVSDFFFTDNTRLRYDFNKIILFNLLYTGGKDSDKANFLFNLLENAETNTVHIHSKKLISTVEGLTYIPSMIVGEILNTS